jgi:hypothetical protein
VAWNLRPLEFPARATHRAAGAKNSLTQTVMNKLEDVGQKGAESAKCRFSGKWNDAQLLHFQPYRISSFICFVCNTSFTFPFSDGRTKSERAGARVALTFTSAFCVLVQSADLPPWRDRFRSALLILPLKSADSRCGEVCHARGGEVVSFQFSVVSCLATASRRS